MKNIIIYGSGGHAKVIADIIEKDNKYSILGFIDDTKTRNEMIVGYPVLGDFFYLNEIKNYISGIIIAIGDNYSRMTLTNKIKSSYPELPFIK